MRLALYVAIVIGWYTLGWVIGFNLLPLWLTACLTFLWGIPTGYLAFTLHREAY
jgi:hypothetical protein